jgi:hypothetical protein
MEECSTFELISAQPWELYNSRFREHEERLLAEATTESAPAADESEAALTGTETDSTSPKEEESTVVDEPGSFDDSDLLKRLISWVRLKDASSRRLIASVCSMLDGAATPDGGLLDDEWSDWESATARRSPTQPLVTTESLARK